MGGTVSWTEENIAMLRAKHGSGLSASQIMRFIPGATRNAIVGKLHRLGLGRADVQSVRVPIRVRGPRTPHVSNGRPTFKPPKRNVPKVVEPYKEPEMPVLEGNQPLHSRPYADLEPGMCHWPLYMEQGVQMYCAAATERLPGRWASYCACHDRMGTKPLPERRHKLGKWR